MIDSGQTAYDSNNVNTRQKEITWRDFLCAIRLVACRCTHDGQCRYEVRWGRLCGHRVLHQHRFVPTLVTTARLARPPYVRNVYVIVMLWKCEQVLSIGPLFQVRWHMQNRHFFHHVRAIMFKSWICKYNQVLTNISVLADMQIRLPVVFVLQAWVPCKNVYCFGGFPHFVCQLPPGAQQLILPLLYAPHV